MYTIIIVLRYDMKCQQLFKTVLTACQYTHGVGTAFHHACTDSSLHGPICGDVGEGEACDPPSALQLPS